MSKQKQTPPPAELVRAALWHGLAKVADKEKVRGDLVDGRTHRVELLLQGTIDKDAVAYKIAGDLVVNHGQSRSSSSGPSLPLIVGWLLAKCNKQTRDKILRELPQLYAQHGNALPELDKDLVAATKKLLERMRARTLTTVNGSVAYRYELEPAQAALFA